MTFDTSDWVCNLMAIDPGSSSLGVAIYELNLKTFDIIRTTAFTVHATGLSQYSKHASNQYGDRFARFAAMENELMELFESIRPSIVICESPFFSRFTPSAFSVLTELVSIIQKTLFNFNNQIPFFKVDPPTAKKAIGAKGNAKKDDMTIALEKVADKLKLVNPVTELDEHAVDACAIGYHGYKKYVLDGGLNGK